MAGLGGFNGDVGGFQIANLAHHDDVRILAQKRLQRGSKGESLLVVYVDLVDAGQVNLGRVFGGGNIHAVGIEDVQAGIKRYGFARAGGAGHQHHAVGAVDGFQNQLFLEIFETQLVDIQRGSVGIQNPHHDFFAEQGGQGADAKVDGLNAFLEHQLDAPVLRNAFFGNIQLGHHLDARSQLAADVERRAHHFAQLAVNPEAHPRTFFVKFKMDVGGAGGQRIG